MHTASKSKFWSHINLENFVKLGGPIENLKTQHYAAYI